MEYQFKGSISIKDFLKFVKIINRKRDTIFNIMILILFIGIYFFPNRALIFDNPMVFLDIITHKYTLAFIALVVGGEWVLLPILNKMYYKSDATAKEERDYCITEDSILMKCESTSVQLTKDKIKYIKFQKDAMYIFYAVNKAVIILRSYFNTQEEFDEITLFINKNYNVQGKK